MVHFCAAAPVHIPAAVDSIATVGRDGTLQVIQGLVRPEDMPKPAEAADGGDTDSGTDSGRIAGPTMSTPMQLPKDREAEARKEGDVGIGLGDDLRSIRIALVKAHLAGDFEAAFDLMVFQLVRAVFALGYTGSPTASRTTFCRCGHGTPSYRNRPAYSR